MGLSSLSFILIILITYSSVGVTNTESSSRGLSYKFYEKTCPHLESIVTDALFPVFADDPTSPAALLRLLFHDCQVQGCDASILIDLNSRSLNPPEISASKNFGIRKGESIEMIKARVEAECPGQVSCADLIVLAAREAVAFSGGPRIRVPFGRRDSTYVLSPEAADASLPSADTGVEDALILFSKLGMTTEEAVAIMGAHTLGVTHCLNIMNRLYGSLSERSNNMDPKLRGFLKLACPEWLTFRENISFVLNDPSAFNFDNLYYKISMEGRGILKIDSELPSNPETATFVERFAANSDDFFQAFSSTFVKLSSAGVLTGKNGVIRSMCSSVDK